MKNILLSVFAVSSFGCASIDYEPYILEPEVNESTSAESKEEVEDVEEIEDFDASDESTISDSAEMCRDGIISPYAAEIMLELTRVSDNEDVYSTYDRVVGIAELFEACSDPWGMFATAYKHITARGIRGIEEGSFEDPQWAESIILDFASRFFANLEAALTRNEPSWAWQRYYDLADRSDVSKTRSVIVAMCAHLLLDLPHSLAAIDSTEENKEDFFYFGDIMIEVADDFIEDIDVNYDTDTHDILNGFFFGEWVDGSFGEDTTITLSYQTVRAKSWNNRWLIQNSMGWVADAEISSTFWAIDAVLRGLDGAGTID